MIDVLLLLYLTVFIAFQAGQRIAMTRIKTTTFLIIIITLHWGFATGSLLAMKTPWSIPRFILICLMMRYFALSYGY